MRKRKPSFPFAMFVSNSDEKLEVLEEKIWLCYFFHFVQLSFLTFMGAPDMHLRRIIDFGFRLKYAVTADHRFRSQVCSYLIVSEPWCCKIYASTRPMGLVSSSLTEHVISCQPQPNRARHTLSAQVWPSTSDLVSSSLTEHGRSCQPKPDRARKILSAPTWPSTSDLVSPSLTEPLISCQPQPNRAHQILSAPTWPSSSDRVRQKWPTYIMVYV